MAALNRLSPDGIHVTRHNHRESIDAFMEWTEPFDQYKVPITVLRERWTALWNYIVPPKDRPAYEQFAMDLARKFRAEEDINFANIQDEQITKENLAVAINEDPKDSLVTRNLVRLMSTSAKLTYKPSSSTSAHYLRIVNQSQDNAEPVVDQDPTETDVHNTETE